MAAGTKQNGPRQGLHNSERSYADRSKLRSWVKTAKFHQTYFLSQKVGDVSGAILAKKNQKGHCYANPLPVTIDHQLELVGSMAYVPGVIKRKV